ncbi:MAG: ABC transporter ATP-binding protein [Bacteroidales bacterium]|jgi:iron complex transport system ATP-binding protein|nr:ABC transporter ATP-binding protein [Bacteroidales bacterium]MDI9592671.1 ABC transporter ATP-binding protein [Bacteroidota bacterium]OQC37008.1 MAG: putative siderophore transport system ATP-binding protein YusV [Bacteroidetes bacterium ADurb.Bin041]HNV49323.1 ABC transporter ATP-binding protein [Bacteroidales bacterium]HOF80554.1 ABC transporter ATP-binding protein [Bacteroidales bacterium]
MMIELNGVDIGYLTGHDKSGVLHQDINLELNLGEFVCMIGPNGAGKSTLIRTISGLQKPLKGNILLDNRNIYQTPPAFLARLISVALTAMVEISNASVYDMVAYGRSPYTNFFGKLSKHDHVIIEKSLESAGIAHLASRKFDTLSDGERQKVLIAKSLAQETPFIFLDEPTAFLDFPGKVEIMQLLREAAWIHGKSILLITHDINLAIQFADRLWLMARHKPIITGIPEDLVLTKKIGLFFDKEKIKFEVEHGNFIFETNLKGKIILSGQGITHNWTAKALRRKGFEVIAGSEVKSGVPFIHISDGVIKLIFKEKTFCFNTIEELIKLLDQLQ